jgi:sugar phosphate permease
MNIYRNPFIVGLWAPVYLVIATGATTMDFLMTAMFIMATLGIIGAYVTDFPLLSGLYMNEVAHKTALAGLFGILFGLMLFLGMTGLQGFDDTADSSPMSPQGMFFATWGVMTVPAYPLMVYFIHKLNKRDLEAEQKIREDKKKERRSKGGGPPIMDKGGF